MINVAFCPNQNIGHRLYEPSPSPVTYIQTRATTIPSQQLSIPGSNSRIIGHQYQQFEDPNIVFQQQGHQCLHRKNISYNYQNQNEPSLHQIHNHSNLNDTSCSRFQTSTIQVHPIPQPTSASSPNSSPGPMISSLDNYISLSSAQSSKVSSISTNQNNQNYQLQRQQQHVYPNYNSIVAALATASVESKAPWSADEDETLTKMYEQIGPQWARISEVLPGRTISQIRSRRNAIESRKRQRQKAAMKQMKIAPELKNRVEQNKASSIYPTYAYSYQPSQSTTSIYPKQITSLSSNVDSSSFVKENRQEQFYCSIESLLN